MISHWQVHISFGPCVFHAFFKCVKSPFRSALSLFNIEKCDLTNYKYVLYIFIAKYYAQTNSQIVLCFFFLIDTFSSNPLLLQINNISSFMRKDTAEIE